jgi:hypothetical protein
MFNKAIRSKAAVISLLALLYTCAPALRVAAQTSRTDSHSVWEWSDDGWKKRIEIRGRAEFTDDYTDIKDVSEGGSVRIEETVGGTSRRLDVARAADGRLQRTYYFNGQARPLDAEGRSWLARLVLEAVRQGAIDVDKRVRVIFERRGLNGVLEEISLVRGDYAKRMYFESLIKNNQLNTSAMQSVFAQAARQISSDYEQAELLIHAVALITDKSEALPSYFEAVATIKSDYEHRRVLSTLLKKGATRNDLLLSVVRSAASISSDYEKATLLKEAAAFGLQDSALVSAFFQATNAIRSDYEHRGVLSAVLKRKEVREDVLNRLLESAARMSSDYEKATLLLEASGKYTSDARLRSAFLRTAQTIKSDYERGRVLSAVPNN